MLHSARTADASLPASSTCPYRRHRKRTASRFCASSNIAAALLSCPFRCTSLSPHRNQTKLFCSLILLLCTVVTPPSCDGLLLNTAESSDLIGPYFIREPPHSVIFSNNTGTVIYCTANGNPNPKVTWETINGQTINELTGSLHVRHDNALVLEPFAAEDYRPDLHSTKFRCSSANPVGVVKSRYVQVRAVVEQRFQVEVYDEFVTAGNTAVLRCHMPTFARDLLEIVAWVEGSSNYIFADSHPNADSKYRMLTTGELYIQKVEPQDAQKSFRCQVKHRLNDEKTLSTTSGRIFVSEAFSSQAPRIVDTKSVVTVEQGKSVELGCLAHGHPPPMHTWYRNSELLLDHSVWDGGALNFGSSRTTSRVRILPNSLIIEKTSSSDSGVFRCVVNNSLGSEIAETQLIIRSPLNVQIGLPIVRVDLGHSLTLNCTVSGGPVKSIEWLHNGRPISAISSGSSALRVRLLSREVLHIGKVDRGDRGMFQCVALNEFESAQAQVQLELRNEQVGLKERRAWPKLVNRAERNSEDAPQLLSVFAEQTLQPGQPLTLKCIASGNPIPQVTWVLYDNLAIPDHLARYRIGDYVTRDSLLVSYVNISSVLPEDGGLFTCSATNNVGTVRHSAKINVFGKPSVRRMPNMTAVAGESISVTCPVGGYPIDTIVWEREGVRLPYNHRQKVFPNGTLTINQLERTTDQGTLTCIARTRDDLRSSAKTSFLLKILVRPVIEPFKFPKSLHQSQRYNLLCTVVKGDPPIKIEWYKDGKKLTAGTLAKTNIIHVTEYSVTLAFESVQPEHRGNYTCVASNSAMPGLSSSHSASMIIHVPPRWRIEPSDTNVVKGKNAVIDCDADAYPQPVITWSRADVFLQKQPNRLYHSQLTLTGLHRELPSDFKPISSNGHFRPYENGSLVIHNANKLDTGFYMCNAHNEISHISKVIKITIQVAAHFETKFRTETVHRGLEARIKCGAFGDKPIAISWFKDKAPFSVNEDSRYDLIETIMNEGIKSELIIRNSDRRDGGLYTCLTSNSYGRDDTNIQLIVQEPPDAPTDIKVSERDGRAIRLIWSTPYSGNSPLQTYVLQHKLENEKWSAHFSNISILASENELTISGLQPVTTYHVRMFAINSLGKSLPSEVVAVQTAEESPGGPPLHIKALAQSSVSIKVNWKPPQKELQFGQIKGYYIGYRLVQSADSSVQADNYIYKTVEVKGKDSGEECTITDLNRASRYEIIVQAFNSKGAGPTSEPLYVKTLEFDPPSPPVLSVSEVTFTYIRLSWITLPDQIVSGYILHYKQETSDWEELRLPEGTSFMHENLRCGTRYQYFLVAFNSAGRSLASQVVSARTDGSTPVAPDKSSLISVNSTTASVDLHTFHDGGCPISHFEINFKLARAHNWTPLSPLAMTDQKLILLNGLVPGNKYHLRITVTNDAGDTDAEYTFFTPMTYQDDPAVLLGSRAPSPVPFYADYLVLVPSVISFVVVVVLLSLVYIIFSRKPRHPPNDCIYGNFDGDNKLQSEANESVIMGDLDLNHNGKKGLNLESKYHANCPTQSQHQNQLPNVVQFQTPYARTDLADEKNLPLSQLNQLRGSPLKYNLDHDGIYATVKRGTPRAPRTADVHLYHFPRECSMGVKLGSNGLQYFK